MNEEIYDECKERLDNGETVTIAYDKDVSILLPFSKKENEELKILSKIGEFLGLDTEEKMLSILKNITKEELVEGFTVSSPIVIAEKNGIKISALVSYKIKEKRISIIFSPQSDLEEKRILISKKAAKKLNTMIAYYDEGDGLEISKKETVGVMVEKTIDSYYQNTFLPALREES